MRLIAASIRNPIAVAVTVALICLFGVMSLMKLPLQLFPDIDRPNITIFTGWRAASPEEAEAQPHEPHPPAAAGRRPPGDPDRRRQRFERFAFVVLRAIAARHERADSGLSPL